MNENQQQLTPEQMQQLRDEALKTLQDQMKSFRATAQELKEHTQTVAIGITLLTLMGHINLIGQRLARIEQFMAVQTAPAPQGSGLIVPGR
jgi:hypothetical protein